MFNKIVHHESMDSISSVYGAETFRKESLIIPLNDLVIFISEELVASSNLGNSGVNFYKRDYIRPCFTPAFTDKFYKKVNRNLVEGKLEDLLQENIPLTELFIESQQIKRNANINTPIQISRVFGPYVTGRRTLNANAKLIAIHAIQLYMQMMGLHSVQEVVHIPSLGKLLPIADEDAWRDFVAENNNHRRSNGLLPEEPNVNEFNYQVFKLISKGIGPVMRSIGHFLLGEEDHFYFLFIHGDQLMITKGIDHKYLPYYEQKFREPEPE